MKLFFFITALLFSSGLLADTIESLVMPGPVIAGHKKLESNCSNCHEIFSKRGQDFLCLKCHKETNKDIKSKKGFHGKNSEIRTASCKSCHTEHIGRKADIIKLDTLTFNHDKTDYKLNGKHKVTACVSCHKEKTKYRKTKNQCIACHVKENPHKKARAKKGLFDSCQSCHRETGWHSIKFNHNKTKYKLTGAHTTALCQSCHINEQYLKTPDKCISCHKVDDVHSGKNGSACQKCHTTKRWGKISFNHKRDTSFPLYGKHSKVPCRSCHTKIDIKPEKPGKKKTARSCYSCHVYDDTHKGRFGKKCQTCHTDRSWDKTKFNHDRDTKFKIRGKHKPLKCAQCHVSAKIKLKSACISCHKNDDVHKGSLGAKCNSCHTENSWKEKLSFEHDLTAFPLVGLHSAVSCEECHSESNYKNIEKTCITCHKNKDIHQGKLGTSCEICHTPNDWGVWIFDHNKQSKFKLTGAHRKIHCYSCHTNALKKIAHIPRGCISCHAADDTHNGQFGTLCGDCHTTRNFIQIRMK